uniref:uncharacterized protein LOC105350026 n=1 Tax=Fragaria vesca subsp. vesca TaxID=101020 RepID=UPI0005C85F95|nr:PREDICTED: uncharacterized protein LOC105350026 [Fragaria vesca subsp. vesca]
MEKVLQRTRVSDQIRLSIACKSWMSIVTRRDIHSASHELPWLLVPRTQHCSNKYLTFASLSDEKFVKLKLPKKVRGWWIYGSSKGWLIMVKENGLNSTMCLLNPISGVLHQLPPLRTLPSFSFFVKTSNWKLFGANEYVLHVALLTPSDINSSDPFTVAIVFQDFKLRKTLGLCKLGDLTWSVFQVLDDDEQNNESLGGVLFSSNTLFALVSGETDGVVAATRTLNLGDHELKLKLVHDKHENKNVRVDEFNIDYVKIFNGDYNSLLLESTGNEILVIHQMLDFVYFRQHDLDDLDDNEAGGDNVVVDNQEGIYQGNDDDDEGNHDNDPEVGNLMEDQDGGEVNDVVIDIDAPGFNPLCRTRSFRVYKIDQNNNNLVPLNNLGDQLLFIGDAGSTSLPASIFPGVERNCVYFTTNTFWDMELTRRTYKSREIGVFYLDNERIRRSFPSVNMSLSHQATWFTPSLK